MIDSKNTGGVEGGGAAAVDVEERGAEHRERTDQTCTHKQAQHKMSVNTSASYFSFELVPRLLDKKLYYRVTLYTVYQKDKDLEFKRCQCFCLESLS